MRSGSSVVLVHLVSPPSQSHTLVLSGLPFMSSLFVPLGRTCAHLFPSFFPSVRFLSLLGQARGFTGDLLVL